MLDKNENLQEKEPAEKSQILLKIILLLGFLLQFIIAYFVFNIIQAFPGMVTNNVNLNLTITLLLSVMLATPLGFLCANFIFHHLPFMNAEMKMIGTYKNTQKTLLKLLMWSVLFASFIAIICLLLL